MRAIQMSPHHQHQKQHHMVPADQSTSGAGTSGCWNVKENILTDEEQMAQGAHENIKVRQEVAGLFGQYRDQLIPNKYGVTVTSDPPSRDEKICITVFEMQKIVPFTVKNSGATEVYFTLLTTDLVKNVFTIKDGDGVIIKTIDQYVLESGEEYEIQVHFCSDYAGLYEQLLIFRFEACQQSTDRFEIMRLLEIIHRTCFDEELLPIAASSQGTLPTVRTTPEGSALVLLRNVVPLRLYPMPDNLRDIRTADRKLQMRPLNWKNYYWRFHLLLHIEELQQRKTVEKYNQDDVVLFRHNTTDILILKIPDVSASDLCGAYICVTRQSGRYTSFKGWVLHVDAQNVYLKCKDDLPSNFKDMRFTVDFDINRIPLRLQHRAAYLAYKHKLKEVLFPDGRLSSQQPLSCRIPKIKNLNPEQHIAIQHIVACSARPAPYLVFGPPGTGKTVTLVEAIKQIVQTQDAWNILVCAPSNSASDHICQKLVVESITRGKVYRLYALNYPVSKIPESIKPCCNLRKTTQTLLIPSKKNLMARKVLVTTLINAGRLVTGGVPPNHFSFIIVDEAGQATETECIIPLAGLLDPQKCQVVLAGDPKQLGPTITSTTAQKHGLGVSFLERLMRDICLYKPHETLGFNKRFVTKLLRNYRSHPAILKIPNELFYKGELKPCADLNKSLYSDLELLPKKGFPVIFHGVAGNLERDTNSSSLYNMAEVEVLKEYLKSIIRHHHKKAVDKIELGEIGIIAPYRKQVEKIQKALQTDKDLMKEELQNILVATVEQFQGKEFNVILMSTVRSNPKLTADKQKFTLGFLHDDKRFNVAMTRAQALLIVVGDPRILKMDQTWNKFIHYCSKEGAYRGIIVSDAKEKEVTLTAEYSATHCEE